jgi:RecA/RadA recombinase
MSANLEKELGLEPATLHKKKVAATTIPELNNELLPGGFAYGKLNLVFGEPSTGKTTLLIQTIAEEMKKDPDMQFVLIPSERGEDMSYYEQLGLDLSRTWVIKKDQYIMEEVIEQVENILVNADKYNIKAILIDSWDGLIPNQRLYDTQGNRKEATKQTVAVGAKVASEKLPNIKGLIGTKDILFLVVCQVRQGGLGAYVQFKTFSGGNALIHNSDIVLMTEMAGFVRKKVDGKDITVGHNVKYTLKKTKLNSNAHKVIEVPYHYKDGWDTFKGIWVEALNIGAIEKLGGGWYECDLFPEQGAKDLRRIRGEDAAIAFFREDESRIEQLQTKIATSSKTSAPRVQTDEFDEYSGDGDVALLEIESVDEST